MALDRRLTAALAIGSAACITSIQDVLIKWISGEYPFHQMQTIRCIAAMPIILVFLLWDDDMRALLTPRWALVSLRSLTYATASVLFYLAAAAMPFPEAVALYFTMPVLVALLAGPVLGEKVRWHIWGAALIGFAGVVVMVKPGSAVFNWSSLVGIGSATLSAFGHMMTRPLGRTIRAAPLAVHQNLGYIAIAGILAAVFGSGDLHVTGQPSIDYLTRGWVMPALDDLLFIMFLGSSTGLLMVLITLAYRLADSSFVAPFEYTAMFWAVLFSFIVFGDWPTLEAFIGIGLIAGSGLFMLAIDGYVLARPPTEALPSWHDASGPSGPTSSVRAAAIPAVQVQAPGATAAAPFAAPRKESSDAHRRSEGNQEPRVSRRHDADQRARGGAQGSPGHRPEGRGQRDRRER